jgi:protein required for attachment to host cells
MNAGDYIKTNSIHKIIQLYKFCPESKGRTESGSGGIIGLFFYTKSYRIGGSMKTLVIVANASEAHCYTYDHKAFSDRDLKLDLMADYQNPSNHKKEDDLVSGRTGSYRTGAAHGSYAPSSDPKENEADHFAKHLADLLEAGRVSHDYDNIVLVLPSHFYGLFNKHLSKEVSPLIHIVIQKDYTKFALKELEAELAQQLYPQK